MFSSQGTRQIEHALDIQKTPVISLERFMHVQFVKGYFQEK